MQVSSRYGIVQGVIFAEVGKGLWSKSDLITIQTKITITDRDGNLLKRNIRKRSWKCWKKPLIYLVAEGR